MYCTYFPGFEIAGTAEYKLALYIDSYSAKSN